MYRYLYVLEVSHFVQLLYVMEHYRHLVLQVEHTPLYFTNGYGHTLTQVSLYRAAVDEQVTQVSTVMVQV